MWRVLGLAVFGAFASLTLTEDFTSANDIATTAFGALCAVPMFLMGRSYVRLSGSELTIQNPVRRISLTISEVTALEIGVWFAGFRVAFVVTNDARLPMFAIQPLSRVERWDPVAAEKKLDVLRERLMGGEPSR